MSRTLITETQLRMELDLRVKKGHKLRDIAEEHGVNHGVIDRALKGRFPTKKDIREDLGLLPDEKTGCEYILELYNILEGKLKKLHEQNLDTKGQEGDAPLGIVCPVCHNPLEKVLEEPMSDDRYLYGCGECEVEAYVPATVEV